MKKLVSMGRASTSVQACWWQGLPSSTAERFVAEEEAIEESCNEGPSSGTDRASHVAADQLRSARHAQQRCEGTVARAPGCGQHGANVAPDAQSSCVAQLEDNSCGSRQTFSDYWNEGVIWRLSRVGGWLTAHWLELLLASQRCVPRGVGARRIHGVVVNSGQRTQRRSQVYKRKMCERIGILSQRERERGEREGERERKREREGEERDREGKRRRGTERERVCVSERERGRGRGRERERGNTIARERERDRDRERERGERERGNTIARERERETELEREIAPETEGGTHVKVKVNVRYKTETDLDEKVRKINVQRTCKTGQTAARQENSSPARQQNSRKRAEESQCRKATKTRKNKERLARPGWKKMGKNVVWKKMKKKGRKKTNTLGISLRLRVVHERQVHVGPD